ncbi:MAG: hypothetical protein QM784_08705 [Polyangiaceae bacterium]
MPNGPDDGDCIAFVAGGLPDLKEGRSGNRAKTAHENIGWVEYFRREIV